MRRLSHAVPSSLADLIEALAPYLSAAEHSPSHLETGFTGVAFVEASLLGPRAPSVRGQVLLAPGLSAADIFTTASQLAHFGAAALVVRAPGSSELHSEPPALPVLTLDDAGDWGQLYSTAQSMIRPRVGEYVASAKLGDLFSAANSLASIAFGAVSFVDDAGRIIGYSTHADQPIDDTRRASTLSLREAVAPSSDAEYREVMRSPLALHFAGESNEYGRVARAVRYANEMLGTVWVVQIDPALAAVTMALLDDVAPVVTQHFLRARNEELDGGQRKRQLVRAILENSADAATAYAQLALPPSQDTVVVSFGVRDDSEAHTQFGLRRLLQLVKGNASTAFAFYECALLENRVVIVISGASEEHIMSFATWVCRADETIAAGIGSVAAGHSQVPRSHHESELVVSALLSSTATLASPTSPTGATGPLSPLQSDATTRIATFRNARNTIALSQVAEAMTTMSVTRGDAFEAITRHDRLHGTQLQLTLRTYFDCGGSVRDAAATLHVHQNTLRYRLTSVTDTLGIDINDAHTRLWLWLRLTATTFTGK
ncbi:PucR family transcriptional regulator [Leucobacter sp. HY1910]